MDWNKEWQQKRDYFQDYFTGNLLAEDYLRPGLGLAGALRPFKDPRKTPVTEAVSTGWNHKAPIFDPNKDPVLGGMLQKEEDEKEVQKWMDFAQSENQKNRDYASQVREEAVRDQYLGSMIGRENSEILATQAQSRARENAALQSFENAANRPWQMMQKNQDDLSRLYGAYLGRAV